VKLPRRTFLHLAGGAAALPALPRFAWGQSYPTRPVRLIIPFPTGGGNDLIGRAIATQLGQQLGRQVIVDNRGAGAGGVVGIEAAANASPDGYTILLVSVAHTLNPALYKLSYDPIESFAPIASMAFNANVLVVNPDLPVKSVQELIALARQRPGQLQYASSGIGTFLHVGAELFKLAAGVNLLHVPFRGAGPATVDVIGGHTKLLFAPLPVLAPHIRSGKLRALGVGSRERNPAFPDIPTISEAGVPGYEAINWYGLAAPRRTPAPIIERLHSAVTAALSSPELQRQFSAEGAEILRMNPGEFGAFMKDEMTKWERVVKEGGIKPE
jgi:tripartite-type tricarboxylate transporter receptor subunit TctC